MKKKKEIGLEEMTLKDFIAIFAMQAYMQNEVWRNETFETAAKQSYAVADAMLEARNGN